MFVVDGERVRKTSRYLEKTVKGMVGTNNTRYKILILSGVLLALEVSKWPSLSSTFYEEGQTQERN